MTLFENYDLIITDKLLEKLKGLSGRNLGDTKGAIDSIFYILLAGLIRRANSDMSTNMLVNQIRKIYDKNLRGFNSENDFGTIEELEGFVSAGETNLSQIFPSMKSQLLNLVTTQSKTSKSETIKYAGFVNGLILKFLAEKLETIDSKEGLMNYLKEHRDPLFERAPLSLIEKMVPALGMHELRDMKLNFTKQKEPKAREEEIEVELVSEESGVSEISALESNYEVEEEAASYKKPLLIIGVIALLALLGYFLYESREELFSSSPQVSSVIEVQNEDVQEMDSLALKPQGLDPGIIALNDLLSSASLPVENEINIESLSFISDSIVLSNSSNPIIDTISVQFESNPRFQIQIRGGHSGGDSQVALRRAFHLKRVLQAKGVDPIRIDAIADNENLDYLKIKIISK